MVLGAAPNLEPGWASVLSPAPPEGFDKDKELPKGPVCPDKSSGISYCWVSGL